jgi:hypothetical protein
VALERAEGQLSVELATASYRSFAPQMGVPVATSLGRPKWPLSYDLTDEVRALMPWGLLGKDLSDDEFTARYRERLEKTGPETLSRVFHAISRKHDGARLVLLCFGTCSRASFATGGSQRTGSRSALASTSPSCRGCAARLVRRCSSTRRPMRDSDLAQLRAGEARDRLLRAALLVLQVELGNPRRLDDVLGEVDFEMAAADEFENAAREWVRMLDAGDGQ